MTKLLTLYYCAEANFYSISRLGFYAVFSSILAHYTSIFTPFLVENNISNTVYFSGYVRLGKVNTVGQMSGLLGHGKPLTETIPNLDVMRIMGYV